MLVLMLHQFVKYPDDFHAISTPGYDAFSLTLIIAACAVLFGCIEGSACRTGYRIQVELRHYCGKFGQYPAERLQVVGSGRHHDPVTSYYQGIIQPFISLLFCRATSCSRIVFFALLTGLILSVSRPCLLLRRVLTLGLPVIRLSLIRPV